MDKKVDIVVIDSGIFMEHPKISKIINGYSINSDEKGVIISENCSDEFGHGTAIYGIINKYCEDANIIPIKIFKDDQDKADVNVLISALKFVHENIHCDIINMSVGVSILKDKTKLYDICKTITECGVTIVAAYDNFGSISYPAEFDCVIGVSESSECRKENDYIFVEGSKMINILANGNMQRCLWKDPIYQMCGGNSFACAHITGFIGKNYTEISGKYNGDVLAFLKEKCIKRMTLDSPSFEKGNIKFNWKKAVIFPFNKENHSLIRYQKMLRFQIVDVFDSKYSGRVGAYTNDLLKVEMDNNYLIKNIDTIDFETFDVLIIGHTRELEFAVNNEGYSRILIEKCLKKGKFVYSYDEYTEFVEDSNFFNPNVVWKEEYKSPLGKLYRSSTPTIGVFGTTSKQGKFSLQLILREQFLLDGYKVGQISSEPTGLLFDMDYCFPFGYSVKTDITRKRMVEYVNKLMHSMDEDKDLIIVGCQSSTLPYDCGNIDDFTFSQIEFLFSTLPDCVVLCVNSFDTFKDIERTIKFIESSIDAKVISLVVYPMKLRNESAGIYSESISMNEDDKRLCLNRLMNQFNLPIFILGEKMECLYEIILNYF